MEEARRKQITMAQGGELFSEKVQIQSRLIAPNELIFVAQTHERCRLMRFQRKEIFNTGRFESLFQWAN